MIAGEYSAAQAYKAFDSQLRESGDDSEETVKAFVEGCEGGFTPFNRGSLSVVSGIAMEVQEDHGTYTLTKVTRDGEAVRDEDTFTVAWPVWLRRSTWRPSSRMKAACLKAETFGCGIPGPNTSHRMTLFLRSLSPISA